MKVRALLSSSLICLSVFISLLVLAWLPESALAAKSGKSTLVIHVKAGAKPNGNGSVQKPFETLSEAVANAKGQVGGYNRIIIAVDPGTYAVEQPLTIDFPVAIHGANVMQADADGWPTGNVQGGSETLLVTESCAGPLIKVAGANADPVRNVELKNLSFAGKAGGCPAPAPTLLEIQYAENFAVVDIVLNGPAGSGLDIAASIGTVRGSYFSGTDACGICVGAGTDDSPTLVTLVDNRSRAHNGGGLLLTGTTYPLQEVGNRMDVNVLHNDLSGNNSNAALGFGVRILAFGPTVPMEQEEAFVTARFFHNRLDNNRNAVMIDAGFPYRNSAAGVCIDERTFIGGFDLVWRDNQITNTLSRKAVLAFTRGQVVTAAANANNAPRRWQNLHNSTFVVDDPDETLTPYTLHHALRDTYVGPGCPEDGSAEFLNNSLFYNGLKVQENL